MTESIIAAIFATIALWCQPMGIVGNGVGGMTMRSEAINQVNACRIQILKCHFDDKKPLLDCLRSVNLK